MIEIGKGGQRPAADVRLSRYACYLVVVQNGDPMIALSSFVLAHLRRLYAITAAGSWCFPASRKDGYVCPKTITKQIVDRQRSTAGYRNRSKQIDSLVLPRGLWKPHDLRRTGATLMTALGVLPEVAERCLNHTEENRVKRIYQRYTYEAEMKLAWERLGNHLEQLTRSPLSSVGENYWTPSYKRIWVRGFEPPTSCTPCKRASQAALHPDIQEMWPQFLRIENRLF